MKRQKSVGVDARIDPIKNNNGITLIALIVTIIVLLILAGISLNLINGGNGIIVQARWSEFVAEYTKLDEQKELYVAGKQMDKLSEEFSKVNWRSLFTNVSYALEVPETMYPVDLNQPFSIFEAADTLQATICHVENLQKSQLFDPAKVDLYRVDMSLLPNVEVRREYVINIASGMLYYIDGEPYKGLIYHTLKYGVSKDNPEFPTPSSDPETDLTIHYLSGYDSQEETQQIPSLSANSATLASNTFARNDYTFQFWKEVKLEDGTPKYGEYTGTVYLDDQSGVDMKGHDMWLEANWTNEPMNTLTLDANGGYFEDDYLRQVLSVSYRLIGNDKLEINKKEGDLYGLELAVEPERLSPVGSDFYYEFTGWFTDSNNGEKKTIGDTYTSAELHQNTLYAHWEKRYNTPIVPDHDLTIHYLSGCTQPSYTQTVPALSSTSVTLDLCKFNRDSEGLTFLGWKIISSAANASAPYQYGGYFDVANHLIKILDEDWEEEILDIIESYEDYEEEPADEESDEPVLTKAQARQAEILEFLEDEKEGVQSLFTASNMSLNGLADWMVSNQNYLKKLQAYEETLDDDDEDVVPDYYDGHKNVNMNGKDLWLEAVWTLYPLTLDANGGTIEGLPRITVELMPGHEYGEVLIDPDDREGHVFVGWFDERSGGKQFVDDDIYAPAELPGKTLYAQWVPDTDPNVVQITFDGNGGTMTDNAGNKVSTLTKNKVIGYQMGSMPEPESDNLHEIFDGWWTQPNDGTKVTSKAVVTGPMTVYAHWTIGDLVFLEKNGGAYYHKYKSSNNIENKFNKWNPVKYDGIQVANGQKIPKQAGGRQLPWTASGNRGIRNWRYVIKPNGGTKTVKSQWKGWYTQPNGAGTKIKWNSRYYGSYGDTLYANWRERKVINYNANGGKWGKSATLKQKYPYVDQKYPKVSNPKQAGYRFLGWFDAPTGGTEIKLKNASYLISGDKTLYAHWEKVEFTFDVTNITETGWTQKVTPISNLQGYTITYKISKSPKGTSGAKVQSTKKEVIIGKEEGQKYYVWAVVSRNGDKIYSEVKEITLLYTPLVFNVDIKVDDVTKSGWKQKCTATQGKFSGYSVTYTIEEVNSAGGTVSTETKTTSDPGTKMSITGKKEGNQGVKYKVWATATKGSETVKSTNYVLVQTSHPKHYGSESSQGDCYTYQSTCTSNKYIYVAGGSNDVFVEMKTTSWTQNRHCIVCNKAGKKSTGLLGLFNSGGKEVNGGRHSVICEGCGVRAESAPASIKNFCPEHGPLFSLGTLDISINGHSYLYENVFFARGVESDGKIFHSYRGVGWY